MSQGTRNRSALVIAPLSALLIGWGMSGDSAVPPRNQPVRYNHQIHAEQLSIECVVCHQGATTRRRAGFPPDDLCRACHSTAQSDSTEEEKLISILESGSPLNWHQITEIADHTLFSHRRHVVAGNIDCVVCHGEVRERTVPMSEPVIDFTGRDGMSRCIDCHIELGSPYAGTDCIACHR